MGLDHHLYKKTYVKNWDYYLPEERTEITVSKNGNPTSIKPERIKYVTEELIVWRKFNALHKWFVDNVQNGEDDCGEYYVTRKKLETLLSILKEVILLKPDEGGTVDVEKLNRLFPTASGFFFGDTSYDGWYFQNVEETIEKLEAELAEDEGESDYYYDSSW